MNYITIENQYLNLLKKIKEEGNLQNDRTGVGTYSIFGEMLKCDTRKEMPIITTKKVNFNAVVSELLWFFKGSTNVNELRRLTFGDNIDKKTIWDDNYANQAISLGYKDGELGPIYGYQWRNYNGSGIDQIKNVIDEAIKNPSSRRLLVSAWNPCQIDNMTLPPCHYGFQLNIENDFIDLSWSQRSIDVFLGLVWNISSYYLLLLIFAKILNKTPRYLVGHLGNAHIYKNHLDQVDIQLSRDPYSTETTHVDVNSSLNTLHDFENATTNDFVLVDYNHHPYIKAPMAI